MPKLHKIAVLRISRRSEDDKIFSGVHFAWNFIRRLELPRITARNIPKGVVVASDRPVHEF